MFAINQKFGVGKVIEITETTVTVYFEEIDENKTMLSKYVKLYPTYESAEQALEMTNEEREEAYAEFLDKIEIMKKGAIAQKRLEELNLEASARLMKHI